MNLVTRMASISVAVLLMLGLVTCGGESRRADSGRDGGEKEDAAPVIEPITPDDVANATYSGIYDEEIQLSDGHYEGDPFDPGGVSRPIVNWVDGMLLTGDLDGDGVDEAATLLTENSGGSGVFAYLAVMGRREGEVVQLGLAEIGDRARIRSFLIEGGKVVMQTLQSGPEDGMCCPTELRRRTFGLADGEVVEESSEIEGMLTLEAIASTEWVLTKLSFEEDAPDEPRVTFVVDATEGKVSGSGGCNNYFASIEASEAGSLTLGVIGSTQMACPDPVLKIEARFLRSLAGVTSYGFNFGQLELDYQDGETPGALFFTAQADNEQVD